ncbi:MAG: metallophosphoesterase [Acidimicrobiia bacterium]|nr:metallophosphoesterase [Acidimicrobiia bacterium]
MQAVTVQVWALGDAARCLNGESAATAARDVVAAGNAPVMMLGDLVAPTGSVSEFANCFDPVWGALKPRMKPTPGNHEYNTTNAAGYYGYFDPIAPYYSWSINGWQMYSINSMCEQHGGCGPGSPQYVWLEGRLRADTNICQAAYWHHPRWSQGQFGNIAKMAPLYELLDRYDVELLFAGNDNGDYMRYPPINASGTVDPDGVTEFIAGTGGVIGSYYYTGNAPAPLVRRHGTLGAVLTDLTPTSWSTRFVAEAGSTFTDSASGTCFDGDPPPGDVATPVATVTTPASNARVPSPVSFAGQATDDVGVDRVRIAIRDRATLRWRQPDGTWATTFRQFDATLSARGSASTGWSISMTLPPGSYGVSARAVDTAGKRQDPDAWVTFTV